MSYSVVSAEYSALIPTVISSFTLELTCPSLITGSSLVQAIETSIEYDLALRTTLSVVPPLVELTPVMCFSIGTFKVYDSATNELVNSFLSSGKGSIDVFTSDRTLVGLHNLYVMTVVAESAEEVER